MAWHWYDFAYAPWTVGKFIWEQLKPQKDQEPGRPPQMSAQGGAVPLVFGKTRITMDIVYFYCQLSGSMWDIRAVLGLCEGPITGVARCWRDKNVMSTPGEYGSIVYTGTRPTQTAWSVPPAADQRGYPGLAYLTANGLVSPNQWQGFGQSSFEVQGLLYATGDATKGDADPAQIVDVLVRDRVGAGSTYGVGVGAPFDVRVATGRDGLAASSYARYVSQEALWLSPALTDRRPAAEHLKDVLDASNSTCLWAGGAAVLEIVPLGDTAVGTYAPYVTAQYALTSDHFLGGRVDLELGAESDVYNVCPVEYLDREPAASATDPGHAYNVAIESDPEPIDSASRGERRADAVAMHSICQRSVALKISRIRAQQMVRARNRYRFTLPWTFCRLEPLDFLTITDDLLGLNAVPVRVEEIEEQIDDQGDLRIVVTAVEWPFGIGGAIEHGTSTSDGPLPANLQPWTAAQQAYVLAARNWTGRTPSGAYCAIVWAESLALFVAVGNGFCGTSPDGITWTTRTIPLSSFWALAWNGSVFVAVGTSACATSPDGITWTARTTPAGTYRAVAWNGSVFCAVGDSGVCATSPDGITWTARTTPGHAYTGIAWSGSLFCAVSTTSAPPSALFHYATSPDGITWTDRASGPFAGTAVIWANRRFVVVGAGVATSPDGIAWTDRTPSGFVSTLYASAANEFVMVAVGLAQALVSVDGGDLWSCPDTPPPDGGTVQYSGIAWNGYRFVTVSASASGAVATSASV